MKPSTLAMMLRPVADVCGESDDPDIRKAYVVLCALLGAVDGDTVDRVVLDALCVSAGLICQHVMGLHGKEMP